MAETSPESLVAPTKTNGSVDHLTATSSQELGASIVDPTSTSPEDMNHRDAADRTLQDKKQHQQQRSSSSQMYPAFRFPTNLPTPPFIDVDGIPNFRSLGGYLSADGKTITRPNLFYRCAHPAQITLKGLEQLETSLGIKAIYDLRSNPEVTKMDAYAAAAAAAAAVAPPPPSSTPTTSTSTTNNTQPPQPPSATPRFHSLRHFTPVYTTEDYGPEALARKLSWYSAPTTSTSSTSSTSPSSPPPSHPSQPTQPSPPYSHGFVNAYRDITTHGIQAYTTIFRHILHRPLDPFLFHCTAGKDRTGVLAALILRLSGVDDQTIAWEYAITEPGLGEWRRLFIERMSASSTTSMTRAEASRVGSSRAGNMLAYLSIVLDGEVGGAEAYLMTRCGFERGEVEVIKRNLVVDYVRDTAGGEVEVVKVCGIQGWTAEGGCVDY